MNPPLFPMAYPSLATQPLPDVLRLIRTLNVGPVTFFHLIQRFGTAGNALAALPELSVRGGRRQALTPSPREAALKEIASVEKFGARMIAYGAADYPALLYGLNDPPPLITVSGSAHLWQHKPVIAMVGARNASANGCQFAQKLARELGAAGLIVASGLARGIDTYVHKGALAGGTVAVIANGIDMVYPPENEALSAQIRELGAIISEQPFGMAPFSGSFPGRNRIIAGMSLGTVVVEASPKSGSLITARFALDYNREVFAVPGSPLDPRAKGCNQLIKQGAIMVESAADIIDGIAHLRHAPLGERPAPAYHSTETGPTPDDAELARARTRILEKLGMSPVSVDELIEQCDTTASCALTVLLELELAGRLRRSSGNLVNLVPLMEEVV